jgi:hypothetical protein
MQAAGVRTYISEKRPESGIAVQWREMFDSLTSRSKPLLCDPALPGARVDATRHAGKGRQRGLCLQQRRFVLNGPGLRRDGGSDRADIGLESLRERSVGV